MNFRSVLVAAACAAVVAACGRGNDAGAHATLTDPQTHAPAGISVGEAWSRATPPGAKVGAAYFTVINRGARADVLLSATTPAAARTELHRTVTEDGMARMRPAGEVGVAAGETLRAEPGGLHLMLLELPGPLLEGQQMPLTLRFRDAGEITTSLQVRTAIAGAGHAPAHP